jgi:alkylation response protein AidB-like acyl-CoA dehydrogenase
MDFRFSEEQEAFRQTIRKFVERETSRELDRQLEEEGRFPFELVEKMAETGLLGLPFPEEYGGVGGTVMDFVIAAEELAYGSEAACGIFLGPVFFAGEQIYLNGSEEQKKEYLPLIAQGKMRGAFALTEPDAGSDASAITTSAVPDGDDYVINGQKTMISGADIADVIMTCTKTDKECSRYEGITLFMVPGKAEGLTIRKMKKLGNNILSTCELFYDNVRIPKENILGGPGGLNQGWLQMINNLDLERIMIAALYTAIAQRAYDDALAYAKERKQFGRPISQYQMIQQLLADMLVEIRASRLLTYHAAWLKQEGEFCSVECSVAKIHATEAARKVTIDGMQVLGGYGYMMEYDMQRYVRNALLGTIGGGTNQIQRLIIAKLEGMM